MCPMSCDVSMYAMYVCVCVCDRYHVSILCLTYMYGMRLLIATYILYVARCIQIDASHVSHAYMMIYIYEYIHIYVHVYLSIYMHLSTYNMYVAMSSRIPYMMHHMCRVSCVCGEMHIDRCITCNYLQMHHMGLMLCDVSMYAMYLCVCVCDKYHVSILCPRYILLYAGTHIRIQYIRYTH